MDSGISPSPKSQRMLAAIVVTDAAGFSKRMSANEEKALRLINQDLTLIADLCELCEGQVLKSTGDGLLMYFFSAVQAVTCALEIQKSFASFGDDAAHFTHRIGIHLGDVFINNSDVMGNGVNIAARLESTCHPGEVCVSQTVYDVVKSRLDLNATFLGPLKLKNIQEEVPAYQIHSANESEFVVPSRLKAGGKDDTQPLTSSTPDDEEILTKIVTALTQHRNQVRIKKLIFSACQNLWENDATVLNQFSLKGLIGTLLQRNPSYEQCKASLYKVVSTLNRKTEYAQVAEVILAALNPLFSQQTAGTMFLVAGEESSQTILMSSSIYQQVADSLDQNTQIARIKKVLYCLCHQQWENNLERIVQLDTSTLVEKLCQLAPTTKDLKYRLGYLLTRLNRKAQYSKVMDIVFQALAPLYQAETNQPPVSLTSLDNGKDEAADARTCFNTATPMPHPEATVACLSQSMAVPNNLSVAPVQLTQPMVKDRSNLCELRLDIVKYCNPLRAKILLFSVLNGPFSDNAREWSALRAKTLDDLLNQVFDYCPTLDDLESKLTILSHCIDDPEASAQVISAITNAIRGYYPPPKVKPARRRRQTSNQPGKRAPQPMTKNANMNQRPGRLPVAAVKTPPALTSLPAVVGS